MPIADPIEQNNSQQSVADKAATETGTRSPFYDHRLEAVVAQDRQDDGLVHNHNWALSTR